MQPDEAGPPGSAPTPPAAPSAQASAPRSEPTYRQSEIVIWLAALTAAALVGVASWLVGERTFQHFQPSLEASSQRFSFAALNRETALANGRNGAVVFGTLGGLLGLGLGLAGGLTQRSLWAALMAAVAGLILGGAAGALPSFVVMPWQWNHRHDDPYNASVLRPMLIHGALWCGLGAAAGLAYALGRGRPRLISLVEGALGGLVGAAVGTAVYEMVGALVFPFARTSEPFAGTAGTRLIAHLCVAVFVAAGAVATYHLRPLKDEKVAIDHGKPMS